MAQAPQTPHKPAASQPHQAPKPPDKKDDKNHEDKHGHTLRDPAEGQPPAVLGEHTDHPRETPRQTIGVKGLPIEDGERDPDTIAEEQRRRSAEMEAMGVEAWKAAHDERSEARVEGTKKLENHKAP